MMVKGDFLKAVPKTVFIGLLLMSLQNYNKDGNCIVLSQKLVTLEYSEAAF